jgi:hypothetical protein
MTKQSAVFQGSSTTVGPPYDMISVCTPKIREGLRATDTALLPLTLMLSAFPNRNALFLRKSAATVLRIHIRKLPKNKLHQQLVPLFDTVLGITGITQG